MLVLAVIATMCWAQPLPARQPIVLPSPQPFPSVAATPEELARLRAAWQGAGPAHAAVARRVSEANSALQTKVVFPPEGGHHNQWYQCESCQLALHTVDAKHHRCPKCKRIYTGFPYDNVVYSRVHHRLTQDLWSCAWAYALAGDERHARRAREILTGYARRYSEYPYHSANMGKATDPASRSGGHVFEQTLNEASWILDVCEAYDLVRESRVFSAEDHRAIREDLLLKVAENIAKHKAGKSNWQTYHNAAFMMIGGVLDRADLVRQAIEDPKNGFDYQMRASVLPGGMWYENSWSYHFYTLAAVDRIVETARRLGIELDSAPQVREMFAVALDYRMADGALPRFGDATTPRIPGERFEAAYHRWREPAFLALLPEGPTWDSVLYGRAERPVQEPGHLRSALKTAAGHAILRSGTATAAFTFGPFGGFHGHFDKLSFVYFSDGIELGCDPGRARSQAYRLPVHRNWYRATISHNTVVVDRASQEGAEGQSELFTSGPDLAAAAARIDRAYPAIIHRRLLVLRPGFLVVADVLTSTDGKPHTFDWLYHNRGEAIDCPAATREAPAPEGQGFEYVSDIRCGTSGEPIRAAVAMDAGRVHILLNGEAGTDVLVGTGVGESVLDRVPMLAATRRGQSACFAAVIDPATKGQADEVDEIEIQPHETSGYVIRVRLSNGAQELFACDPTGNRRTVEGVETQSKLLCLRQESQKPARILWEAKD
ncbi:MAG TPA: alginate lyase family protein [Candidatus Paceibacterota bacterium]|nr:alginate lyase family protein [Verrucomicrobiota bacterium]HOX03849.1 alginate lyase family protein [Verrucomicrobiota bacterium]HRZ47452.1 alginate lyase family protein [Candidatus Paceibacterota bacterium]HRZ92410.1 alginate lyase family protein [Candidatus Paceibacterota bacterium]